MRHVQTQLTDDGYYFRTSVKIIFKFNVETMV